MTFDQEHPRSSRPAPRTPAALEAELRRRLRADLAEAAGVDGGNLTDEVLATIIARAISTALTLHTEAEHTRGPGSAPSSWRSAEGPRGRPQLPRELENERFDSERPRDFRGRDDFEGDRRPPRGPFPARPNDRDEWRPGPRPSGRREDRGDWKPRRGPNEDFQPRRDNDQSGPRPPFRGGGFGKRGGPPPRFR